MKDYRSYSFWLDTADDDLSPRPPLDGSIDVDIAILGAGFTGLWTAYHLLVKQPSLKVAVVEAEIEGFGASGRNGGWSYASVPVSPGESRVAKAVRNYDCNPRGEGVLSQPPNSQG